MEKKPLVIGIAGPTATGKTEAAIAVCKALHGEVLSMDSMQIYKDFTIGTAKPDASEMQGVPHHLLSYVAPDASYSVAAYQKDARRIMKDVLDRGMLPVFAGGTGLYLQAVSHSVSFTQTGKNAEIRKQLEAEAAQPEGPKALHIRLATVDPLSAQRLHTNNTRRIVRALEVYLTTGEPISAQQTDWEDAPDEDWLIFALTLPREVLYQRINARVDRMIERGLVGEVEQLLRQGVPRDAQAMKAIGYKEIVCMLEGEYDLATAIEKVKMNTRRYAKRQLTWLRRDERVRWLDISTYPAREALHADIIERINEYREQKHGD